ncbi:transcriptional regulator with XRE-family HTH domain/predicted negative regulator of RcsB-dependent stress response [Amycolatopsis lexingtonensis]|uniref:Transcriptional regulator with XRE-family HTH domain/predicted negative regulator of RcsB-dependent stress response n=4 Tax=Amycolatopsis lexingtonensis TaxID=218822 RepID=A0ABR9I607_9PSEU|nr:transcriptional regulator with XRE-family HTH domain/predicted negative regulator of RcsB-dependent stress response [Amycolatopsis lexingtonensis]
MTEPLGARIRRLRTDRGWTQRELAEPGYDRGFLAKVETGSRPPSDEMLAYLSERFGLTVDELRFGRPPGVADELRAALDEGYRDLEQGRVADAETRFAAVAKQAAGYHLDDVECYARFCQAEVKWQLFDVAGAQADLEHAEELAAAAPPWLRAMIVHRWSGCRYLSGDAGTAIARVEAELAAGPADPDAELCLLSALIHPLMEMGGLHRARRAAEDGRRLARAATRPDFVARFHRQASQVWQAIGRADQALHDLTEACRLFTSVGFDRDAARCRWARGYLLRRLGRLTEARAELTEARDQLAAIGSDEGLAGATVELAEVRLRQGAPDEAAALVAEVWPLLARDVEALGEATGLRGQIAQAQGDPETAIRLLREAAEIQTGASLHGAAVSTSLRLGDALRQRGQLAEAIEAYRRGLDSAAGTEG